MNAGWLVYALLVGTLVAAAAHAVEGLGRTYRRATRWIWAASLAATLAAILLATAPGGAPIPSGIAARGTMTGSTSGASATTFASLVRDLRALTGSAIVAAVAAAARRLPAWIEGALGRLWLAAALAALATFAFVHLRLRRTRRSWPAAELHGRRVRVAPATGPAVVGLVRPEIVVPHWLLARDADEQRLVLAHEEEHVRAGDQLLLGGACIAVALMPWHPAAWWMLARLRLAIELDCDARVLRRGVHARSYGEMLIDLAGQCSGFRVGATALADKTSHLERRLLAMTPTTLRHSFVRGGALCAAAALALAAACEARVPTSAEVRSMDVAGAERAASTSGLLPASRDGKTEFYVNDARVTAQQAHAIAASDIASVDVLKAKTEGGATVIRITTVAMMADGAKYRTGNAAAAREGAQPSALRGLHEKMSASAGDFTGIILIDGVRADASALHRLDPKDIAGVEVIKGAAAMQLMSDPAAKNGIIRVKTLSARTSG
jgi:beta-lactamase regulating signal transducer with metallopeptidase domain